PASSARRSLRSGRANSTSMRWSPTTPRACALRSSCPSTSCTARPPGSRRSTARPRSRRSSTPARGPTIWRGPATCCPSKRAEAAIPTQWGEFTCIAFESVLDGEQHVAFVRGDVQGAENVLVRVHSECLTGDVFGSLRCDCGPQLDAAMEKVAEAGVGAVVYL